MRIAITKCHGSGNDFPMVDARGTELRDVVWAQVARVLADRAGPVGGDGLLLLTEGDADHAFGMVMYNSDGSEAELCLNGLRCVARMGFEALGIASASIRCKASSVLAEQDAAIADGVYTVAETAGPASLDVAAWPLLGEGGRIVDAPIAAFGTERSFTAVAMPNPHLVSFGAIDEAELVRIGSRCEAAPAWLPNRANVSFVEMLGADAIFVRTFERGVGLTDSCGSAMAASTFAAGVTGRVPFGTALTVRNRGGLVRAAADATGMVRLSGNATWEWQGSVAFDPAQAMVSDLRIDRACEDEIAAWTRAVAAG